MKLLDKCTPFKMVLTLVGFLTTNVIAYADQSKLYGPGEIPTPEDVSKILGAGVPASPAQTPRSGLGKRKSIVLTSEVQSNLLSESSEQRPVSQQAANSRPEVADPTSEEFKPSRNLAMQIVFLLNSSDIQESSYASLNSVASGIKSYNTIILIEGHTDALGSHDFNLVLSYKRAEAVKRFLVGKGIDSSRLITRGLAATQLHDRDNPYSSLNRRVQFSVVN